MKDIDNILVKMAKYYIYYDPTNTDVYTCISMCIYSFINDNSLEESTSQTINHVHFR